MDNCVLEHCTVQNDRLGKWSGAERGFAVAEAAVSRRRRRG